MENEIQFEILNQETLLEIVNLVALLAARKCYNESAMKPISSLSV